MKLPTKTIERRLFNSGYRYVIGVDEVGMGCLAGPVVVCAVGITNHFYKKHYPGLRGLRESKLLSTIQREKFAAELLKNKNLKFKICYSYPKTIDKINIYQAARLGMKKAIKKVSSIMYQVLNPEKPILNTKYLIQNTIILVDGPRKVDGINTDQLAIVKGDRKIFAIACASIIAKVHRDKMMARYAKRYPNYGFEKHKGYGTKYHQAQLIVLGPCEIHRMSFAPVRKLV